MQTFKVVFCNAKHFRYEQQLENTTTLRGFIDLLSSPVLQTFEKPYKKFDVSSLILAIKKETDINTLQQLLRSKHLKKINKLEDTLGLYQLHPGTLDLIDISTNESWIKYIIKTRLEKLQFKGQSTVTNKGSTDQDKGKEREKK